MTEATKEHDLAIKALEKALNNDQIVAVQCSLKYADVLFEQRNYERTIEVCENAFCYGESQPSATMGYFLYLIALSKDALIHIEKAFSDEDRVRDCFKSYQAAQKILPLDRFTYRNNIKLRVYNLTVRSNIESGIQF